MAGTKEGAQKARNKNLAKDPNYYGNIGRKSWKNPERSHVTGFAKLPREKHIELSSKGGKKTKNDYQTALGKEAEKAGLKVGYYHFDEETEYETAESIHEIFKDQDCDGPILSE